MNNKASAEEHAALSSAELNSLKKNKTFFKNKKLGAAIYICILLWGVALVQIVTTRLTVSEESMTQAFARNQLEISNSVVEVKVTLGQEKANIEELKKAFGEEVNIKTSTQNGVNYIHFTASSTGDLEEVLKIKNSLISLCKKSNLEKYDASTLVEGSIKKKLSTDEKKQLCTTLQAELGAMIVKTIDQPDYYVAYGYTTGLSESIMVNGRKTNVNTAITYDEENETTRIYMGTPLLTCDF